MEFENREPKLFFPNEGCICYRELKTEKFFMYSCYDDTINYIKKSRFIKLAKNTFLTTN